MKTLKNHVPFTSIKLAAVFFTLLITGCNPQEEAVTQNDDVPGDKIAALVELASKPDYTEAEAQKFAAAYKSLSYEELVRYREVQIEKVMKEYGDTKQVRELMAQNLAEWQDFNTKSIELYGAPSNQVSAEQVDALLTTLETTRATAVKSGRTQASCPVINFNTSFGRGNNSDFSATSAREVDPGAKNDCDCQLAYATTNSIYNKVRPRTINAGLLLEEFGNRLGGRRITGASAGTYPVFGKTRVALYYPNTVVVGCNSIRGEYYLSR